MFREAHTHRFGRVGMACLVSNSSTNPIGVPENKGWATVGECGAEVECDGGDEAGEGVERVDASFGEVGEGFWVEMTLRNPGPTPIGHA